MVQPVVDPAAITTTTVTRGRPRLAERAHSVSCWLTTSERQRLIDHAKAKNTTISATIRAIVLDRVRTRSY